MQIVEQLHGLDGRLSPGNTHLLKLLLHNPDPQLWLSAKNMIISNRPILTLNKAVRCVTPDPQSESITPDPFTLYRALRFSITKQEIYRDQFDVCDVES